MAHVAKFTAAAAGHMLSHYDRSKNGLGDNIDKTLTQLNYNLAPKRECSQIDFIRGRLSEIKVQHRKDINIICDWVVTKPQSIRLSEEKLFFQKTFEFLAARYGTENVISAYVHNDEATPHLHFAFLPVVPDRKKGGYKLSAKECITRNDLRSFHEDLSNYLQGVFGRDVGILNESTKSGNKSIKELKQLSAREEFKILEENTELKLSCYELKKQIRNLKAENCKIRGDLEKIGKILNALPEDALEAFKTLWRDVSEISHEEESYRKEDDELLEK